jgi:hypothetical protein
MCDRFNIDLPGFNTCFSRLVRIHSSRCRERKKTNVQLPCSLLAMPNQSEFKETVPELRGE